MELQPIGNMFLLSFMYLAVFLLPYDFVLKSVFILAIGIALYYVYVGAGGITKILPRKSMVLRNSRICLTLVAGLLALVYLIGEVFSKQFIEPEQARYYLSVLFGVIVLISFIELGRR